MSIIYDGPINERLVGERGSYRIQPFSPKNHFQVVKKSAGNVAIVVSLASGAKISFPYVETVYGDFHFGSKEAEDTPIRVYLSPDAQYFLIEKHLSSGDNAGQALVRIGTSARPYLINGLPFDEACIEYFCRTHHIPVDRVTDGGRSFLPMFWRGNAVSVIDIASFSSGSRGKDKRRSIFFRVEYDFARRRFLSAKQVPAF